VIARCPCGAWATARQSLTGRLVCGAHAGGTVLVPVIIIDEGA